MNRQIVSNLVAYFLQVFLFSFMLTTFQEQLCHAETKFSKEEMSSSYLLWLAVISISFVQGAANGLFILGLRKYRFDFAGYRWTQGFWLGFPLALLSFIFLKYCYSIIHADLSFIDLGGVSISLWIAVYLVANALGSFYLSLWAAKE